MDDKESKYQNDHRNRIAPDSNGAGEGRDIGKPLLGKAYRKRCQNQQKADCHEADCANKYKA
ncbi:hypothetical protein D9M68_886050 [compost metagenome]